MIMYFTIHIHTADHYGLTDNLNKIDYQIMAAPNGIVLERLDNPAAKPLEVEQAARRAARYLFFQQKNDNPLFDYPIQYVLVKLPNGDTITQFPPLP